MSNNAENEGGILYTVLAGQRNKLTYNLTDIVCLNTTARDGGVVYLVSKRQNLVHFKATKSYFFFNVARYGGVMFFYTRGKENMFNINIDHCFYKGTVDLNSFDRARIFKQKRITRSEEFIFKYISKITWLHLKQQWDFILLEGDSRLIT